MTTVVADRGPEVRPTCANLDAVVDAQGPTARGSCDYRHASAEKVSATGTVIIPGTGIR
jgi:hypothetical protein